MSMGVGQIKLRDAYKQLKFSFEQVKEHWNDQARRDFENEFLAGLESKVLTAIGGIGRLQEVSSQAERECQ